jgi:hypothetical protein
MTTPPSHSTPYLPHPQAMPYTTLYRERVAAGGGRGAGTSSQPARDGDTLGAGGTHNCPALLHPPRAHVLWGQPVAGVGPLLPTRGLEQIHKRGKGGVGVHRGTGSAHKGHGGSEGEQRTTHVWVGFVRRLVQLGPCVHSPVLAGAPSTGRPMAARTVSSCLYVFEEEEPPRARGLVLRMVESGLEIASKSLRNQLHNPDQR